MPTPISLTSFNWESVAYRKYWPTNLSGDLLVGVAGEGIRRADEDGMLRFFDPQTENYLDTHDEERAGSLAAAARVAELEEELRRLRDV